jgi:class 3 adenylate cyclase/CHASE2 domain-containing sensor protein
LLTFSKSHRVRLKRPARDILAVMLVVGATSAAVLAPGPQGPIAGLSTDLSFWLRNAVFGPRRPAGASPVALVLIDEATYATYANQPKDFWAPYFGQVISGLDHAGVRLIGFDILLPMTVDLWIPGHDKPFLQALQQAGPPGKLVLIKGQAGGTVVLPSFEQQIFAGGLGNIRSDALQKDSDGVVRRQPLAFATTTQPPGQELSFAAEIARRAGWQPPGGQPPGGTLMLNFDGGQPFETYSLAELAACVNDGHADFMARHFKNRIVLIGTGLQFEDRQLTSRRFINPPEQLTGAHCESGFRQDPPAVARDDMPGVFIQATTIDNLLRNEGLQSFPAVYRALAVLLAALAGALLSIRISFVGGGIGLCLVLAGIVLAATIAFQHALAVPMLDMLLAAGLSYFLLLGYRLVIVEHGRRRIRSMFGLYLAPSIIARLESMDTLPERSSERRRMTFFFSDISGFTTLTEAADPAVLSSILNSYFDGVCAAVEAEGGIVIEFLGDGVQAMFGAPTDQPDHAKRAVAAARSVDLFSESFRSSGVPKQLGLGHTRLGIHTGDVLVGNIGASRRLKYAALGDVVNATSRLEGLNKYFGTRICISEETVTASGDPDTRPIGDFILKGKTNSLRIYELLAAGSPVQAWLAQYREAYRLLSEGNASALEVLTDLKQCAPDDYFVEFYLARARAGELNTIIKMEDK